MSLWERFISSVRSFGEWLDEHIEAVMLLITGSVIELERRLMMLVTSYLKRDSWGRLHGARTNLKNAQKIQAALSRIFDETYGRTTRKAVAGLETVTSAIREMWKEAGLSARWGVVDSEMATALTQAALDGFKKYGKEAQQKIVAALYNNVAAMAPFKDLQGAISAALTGQLDKRGRSMTVYATQFATDAIMGFYNAVTLKKAEDAGITSFLYAGSIIKDSRKFCVDRCNRVFTREEIESWTFDWNGKSGPALTHRGGHNCRHAWYPVEEGWIDEEALENATRADREQWTRERGQEATA